MRSASTTEWDEEQKKKRTVQTTSSGRKSGTASSWSTPEKRSIWIAVPGFWGHNEE